MLLRAAFSPAPNPNPAQQRLLRGRTVDASGSSHKLECKSAMPPRLLCAGTCWGLTPYAGASRSRAILRVASGHDETSYAFNEARIVFVSGKEGWTVLLDCTGRCATWMQELLMNSSSRAAYCCDDAEVNQSEEQTRARARYATCPSLQVSLPRHASISPHEADISLL